MINIDLNIGDCREILLNIEDNSVHLILTDPPYFLDGLDDKWKKGQIEPNINNVIKGMPVGMKFDTKQGKNLQEFLSPVCMQMARILKPGGFLLMFSSPRLYHRVALTAEDAGFEVRDVFAWNFTKHAQFKAFGMNHFIDRMDISSSEKENIKSSINKRKTPQLRPQFELILCAQKPREGTFVENWMKYRVGLIDASQTLTGNVPDTLMKVEKEKRKGHLTPKPIKLLEHLIMLFSEEDQIVLDPFVGSGSTCIAAMNTHRRCIGIDINPEYIELATKRISV